MTFIAKISIVKEIKKKNDTHYMFNLEINTCLKVHRDMNLVGYVNISCDDYSMLQNATILFILQICTYFRLLFYL